MEIVYIRISKEEKDILKLESKKLEMPLTTYCRMVLINHSKRLTNYKINRNHKYEAQ